MSEDGFGRLLRRLRKRWQNSNIKHTMQDILKWIALLTAVVGLLQGIKMLLVKDTPPPEPPPTKPVKKKPRLTRKQRRQLGGGSLVAVSLLLSWWVLQPEPALASMTTNELLERAWKKNDQENWDQVERYASAVAERFAEESIVKALGKLKAELKPAPKTGIVGKQLTEQEASYNHEYGLINDYATAHYLLGQAALAKNNPSKAEGHFQSVMKFPEAVTYNPKTREFWRTADGAENALLQLQKKRQPPASPVQ